MLSLAVGTLSLFARTAIVSGSEALPFIHPHEGETMSMSEDTFEWLQTVKLRVEGLSGPKNSQALSFPRNDPYVETALKAWTTDLKKMHMGRQTTPGEVIKVEDIDAQAHEVELQFSNGVVVWKEEYPQRKRVDLLIIRKTQPNRYEWKIMVLSLTEDKDIKTVTSTEMYRRKIDTEITIHYEVEGKQHESRLTEISRPFFEQRVDNLKWEGTSVCEEHRPQMMQKGLPKHESDGRDAITRSFYDAVPELTAAIITQSTRCLTQKDVEATGFKAHQEELARIAEEKVNKAEGTKNSLATDMADLDRELSQSKANVLELQKQLDDSATASETEREEHKKRESEWISEKLQLERKLNQVSERAHETLQESEIRKTVEREAGDAFEQLLQDRNRDQIKIQKEEAQRQLDEEQQRHNQELHDQNEAMQREVAAREQEKIHSEEELRQKESENEYLIIMALLIGGGVLAAVGFTIFVLARKSYNEMSDDMEYELNAQLRRVKEPHPLVPEYPSAHANRLGVHEHPAVRDVFGMKEPWDVTPGEGFHVSRITSGGGTPGTTRAGTGEGGDVIIEIPDQSENDAASGDSVSEKDRVSVVVENEVENANEAVEESQVQMIEGYEDFDI